MGYLLFSRLAVANSARGALEIVSIAALALNVGVTSMKSRVLSGNQHVKELRISRMEHIKKQVELFAFPLVLVVIVSILYV